MEGIIPIYRLMKNILISGFILSLFLLFYELKLNNCFRAFFLFNSYD